MKSSRRTQRSKTAKTTSARFEHQAKKRSCSLCAAFGSCGGCTCLDTPYKEQLDLKKRFIEQLFSDIAQPSYISDVRGMTEPFAYRNKITSPFAPQRRKSGGKKSVSVVSGMYQDGTHRIIPVSTCPIENPLGQKIVHAIVRIMERHGIAPYDEDSGEGFLRHAIIRIGHESGEVLVTLVTNTREFPHARSFCKALRSQVPEITTVVQNVNSRQTNVILGEEEHTLYGPGFILDTLCGLSFRISSRSFFQVNAEMTSELYRKAIALAEVDNATIIDAYCGTGTLGLVCAKTGARRIIGVDTIHDAIRDARLNASHNGIENGEFIAEDATSFMKKAVASKLIHDDNLVIIMDPPRAGSTAEFIEAACSAKPQRVVYISCNPITQRRDAELFIKEGYCVDAVVPVDMFPHTCHVENIIRLVRMNDPSKGSDPHEEIHSKGRDR